MTDESKGDVPNGSSLDGPKEDLVPIPFHPKLIRHAVQELALRRYHTCGQGIDFGDIRKEFGFKKSKSQRVLKRSCDSWFDRDGKHPPILFRSPIRMRPQKYYPAVVRADIIERLKRQNVLIEPTEVPSSQITPFSSSKHALSVALENNRASKFLEALLLIPFQPLFIHNLHLSVIINREEFENISGTQEKRDKYVEHWERIGRIKGIHNVEYILYPKGKIMTYVRCSERPFRLETDSDVSHIFSFLGQVRDRMVLWLSDVRETAL